MSEHETENRAKTAGGRCPICGKPVDAGQASVLLQALWRHRPRPLAVGAATSIAGGSADADEDGDDAAAAEAQPGRRGQAEDDED